MLKIENLFNSKRVVAAVCIFILAALVITGALLGVFSIDSGNSNIVAEAVNYPIYNYSNEAGILFLANGEGYLYDKDTGNLKSNFTISISYKRGDGFIVFEDLANDFILPYCRFYGAGSGAPYYLGNMSVDIRSYIQDFNGLASNYQGVKYIFDNSIHTVMFTIIHSNVTTHQFVSYDAEFQFTLDEPIPYKEGYSFVAWYKDEALTRLYNKNDNFGQGTILYPKFEINQYNVQYHVEGVKVFDGQLNYNTVLDTPNLPGHTFGGWFTDADFKSPHSGVIKSNVVLYAKITPIPYTINVYGYNDKLIHSSVSNYGTYFNVGSLIAPTVEGYTFENFYTDRNFVDLAPNQIPVASDITLYANYIRNEYKVNAYGFNGEFLGETLIKHGEVLELGSGDDIEGYTFDGWYINPNFTIRYTSSPIKGNLTLYGRYIAKVYNYIVYGQNGSILSSGTIEHGSAINLTPPVSSDKDFDGWYSDVGYTVPYVAGSEVISDTYIYAKFDYKTYKVTFFGLGDDSNFIRVNAGSLIPEGARTPYEYEGHIFSGWYTSAMFVTLYNFDTPIQNDVNLYGKHYADSYVIPVYGVSGSKIYTISVSHNGFINTSDLNAPDVTGYTFNKWVIGGGITLDISNPVTSAISITAVYDRDVYKVDIYKFDGTKKYPSGINQEFGKAIDKNYLKADDVVGYSFNGWFTDSNFINSFDVNSYISSNVSLYPQYSIKSYNYKIFGFNGLELQVAHLNHGETIPASNFVAIPVTGYTFAGWYKDTNYAYAFNASIPLEGDVNVYAKYTLNKYNVTVYGFNNQVVYNGVVEYGSLVPAAALQSNPVTGYKFDSFYSDSNKTVAYNPNLGVYENKSIYANYVKEQYFYKVYGFNNEVLAEGYCLYGDTIPAFTAPDVLGYKFIDWYVDSGYLTKYNPAETIKSNTYIYGKYINDGVIYKIYGFEDVLLKEGVFQVGNKIPSFNAPAVVGKVFIGWYSDAIFMTPFSFGTEINIPVAQNIYAKYIDSVVSYKVFGPNNTVIASGTVDYMTGLYDFVAPALDGYTFEGWYKDAGYLESYDMSLGMLSATNIYAKYIADPVTDTTVFNWKALVGGVAGLMLLIALVMAAQKVFFKKKKRF